MSNTTIQRTDLSQRPTQIGGAQTALQKPFDPAKAAQKAAAEPKPLEARGLHSQVLAEAMDGDASEAMMRGALGAGKRDGLMDDDGTVLATETERVQKQHRTRTVQPQGDDGAARGAEQTGRKSAAQRGARFVAAERAEGVGKTDLTAPTATGGHDELMMLSATMNRRDLATFVARKHAARLAAIFAGDAWQVNREATNRLNAAQMPL